MANMNIGSIATKTFTRIQEVNSSVSGVMIDLASGAVQQLGNIINQTLSPPFTEIHEAILIDMTAVYALQRQLGIGVDFNYSLGEFSVSKGAGQAENVQMGILVDRVNASVKGLGRRISYYKAFS